MNNRKNGALEQLENLNIERGKLFSDFPYFERKDACYYSNAAAGELGELCNMLKKFLREKEVGGKAFDKDGTEITPYTICLEAADVIIYLEFFTAIFGLSLSELLRYKFNEVSHKKNCDLLIEK